MEGEGLPKHRATALTLLRTEVLGLNAWLAQVRVPGITPHCQCGWHSQTIRHVFFGCTRHNAAEVVREARTDNLAKILSTKAGAHAAVRWFVRTGLLQQFQVAEEIDAEDIEEYNPFPEPNRWRGSQSPLGA